MNHIDEPALASLSSNHPSHSNVHTHVEMEHDTSKAATINDVTTETVDSANIKENDVGNWLVTIANTPLPLPLSTETETSVPSTAVQNTRDGARMRGMFKAVSKFKKSAKRAKMTVAEQNFRRNSGLPIEEEEEDVQAVVVEAKVKEIISKEMPEEAAVEVDPKPATSDVETVETVETNDFVTTNSTSLGTFLNNDDLGNEIKKKSKKKKKSPKKDKKKRKSRSRKSGTASGDASAHTTHSTKKNQVNELGHRPSMLHVNDE